MLRSRVDWNLWVVGTGGVQKMCHARSSKYYIYYFPSDHLIETNELIILKYLKRYRTILMQLVHFEPYIATYIPKLTFHSFIEMLFQLGT